MCQNYLGNFNLTIEYFEKINSSKDLLPSSNQCVYQYQTVLPDPKISDIRCYAELNDTQKVLVDKEKYFYYSFDDLKTIIPDVNVYDKLDLKRYQKLTEVKKPERSYLVRNIFCMWFCLLKSVKN